MDELPVDPADLAQDVASALQRSGRQLVLAESCTAGLIASSLSRVPGISQYLCGSAVVYQERTKTAWIDVPERSLADAGAVTADVARAMCAGVLARTPFADIAAAVTGHLGPHAPEELDGVIFIAVQRRGEPPAVERHSLVSAASDTKTLRVRRQSQAAALVLKAILDVLDAI